MRPRFILYALLFFLLAITALLSIGVGQAGLGLFDLSALLSGRGSEFAKIIFFDIRLPRLILALAIGAALGISGAAIQALLRNPLAEPSLLGASNVAALGAVAMIYFGIASQFSHIVPIIAALGAFLSVWLLLILSGRMASNLRIILAGFAISAFAGAGISLLLNLAPNPFAALEIAFWLLGSVEDSSMQHVVLALPLIMAGGVILLFCGRGLDALALGDEVALSMGVNIQALYLQIALGIALAVGAAVSVSGVVGFVGLIVPHMVRHFVDHEPSKTLLPSAMLGAILVGLADSIVRIIPSAGGEIKLGVLTALLGVPVFLFLISHMHRS